MNRTATSILLLAALAAAGAGCGGGGGGEEPPEPLDTTLELVLSRNAVEVGENVRIEALLRRADGSALAIGTVAFSVDGAAIGKATTGADGRAALDYRTSSAGKKAVRATFAGDPEHRSSNAVASLSVQEARKPPTPARKATRLVLGVISGDAIHPGDDVTLVARLSDGDGLLLGDRIVSMEVEGRELGQARTDEAGLARFDYRPESAGGKLVRAEFAGDARHLGTIESGTLEVEERAPGRRATTLEMSAKPGKVVQGDEVECSALLRAAGKGEPIAGSTVIFSADGAEIERVVTDESGEANARFMPAREGDLTIRADFLGDEEYEASSDAQDIRVLGRAALRLGLPAGPVLQGEPVSIGARLLDGAGAPIANRAIAFEVGSEDAIDAMTDDVGRASIQIVPEAAGDLTVRVRFDETAELAAASDAGLLRVEAPKPVAVTLLELELPSDALAPGTQVAILVRLTRSDGTALADKTVEILIAGEDRRAAQTDGSGEVVFDFAAESAGEIGIHAGFAGDADNAAASAHGLIHVEESVRAGTIVFFNELVAERIENSDKHCTYVGGVQYCWSTSTFHRDWILWGLELETGDQWKLAESSTWEKIQYSSSTGSAVVGRGGELATASVVDGEFYLNGHLADPRTGEFALDVDGERIPVPEPALHYTIRRVEESVIEIFNDVNFSIGDRKLIVIEERDRETGDLIRDVATLMESSTIAEFDVAANEELLRLLGATEADLERLRAMVERDAASARFANLGGMHVDGQRLFLADSADERVEILVVDPDQPEPEVRLVHSLDRAELGPEIEAIRFGGNRVLVNLKENHTFYLDLGTGEKRSLDAKVLAVLPPAGEPVEIPDGVRVDLPRAQPEEEREEGEA